MNKWKITFIFLTGFMLREVMAHIWLSIDGMLPYTSKLLGITITPDFNTLAIALNVILLVICGYFGFVHSWERRTHVQRHA